MSSTTEKPKDGGPAFPGETTKPGETGLTLRDWFAGQALAASDWANWKTQDNALIARDAYRLADAMLAARSGEGGGDHG
jgi:hypothetical protein